MAAAATAAATAAEWIATAGTSKGAGGYGGLAAHVAAVHAQGHIPPSAPAGREVDAGSQLRGKESGRPGHDEKRGGGTSLAAIEATLRAPGMHPASDH